MIRENHNRQEQMGDKGNTMSSPSSVAEKSGYAGTPENIQKHTPADEIFTMINKKQTVIENKKTIYEFMNTFCLNKSNKEIIDLLAEEVFNYQSFMYEKAKRETIRFILEIVENWYDTSIKDPTSKIALMVTNGGYISKFALRDKIKETFLQEAKK